MPLPRMRDWFAQTLLFCLACLPTVGQVQADIVLSEVYYDHPGADDGFEWVEIFNAGAISIDLSSFSLGYGGTDYTYGTLQLSGTIAPGQYFVVGGPNSEAGNGNPIFDVAMNFDPDIQNSGTSADGVALFDVLASSITSVTVPIDVVLYGGPNNNNLIDESGAVASVDVGDASPGSSITFDGGGWSITSTLFSGSLVAIPEPAAAGFLGILAAIVTLQRRRRAA